MKKLGVASSSLQPYHLWNKSSISDKCTGKARQTQIKKSVVLDLHQNCYTLFKSNIVLSWFFNGEN